MIQKLLERYSKHAEFIGDTLNDVCQVGVFGSQILHLASFAGHLEDVKEALSSGAEVNAIGDLGLSPLHYAVLGGNLDVAQLLVSKGADLTLENEFGESPVQMAHLMGQTDIEKVLIELGSVPVFGFDGGSTAKERWIEFKSIQEQNFWSD